MIQLRHLRYFVGIVDAGSLSRAATTLYVAQPALSQQMAELEQALGVALLHRSARGVRPTPAGDVLYLSVPSELSGAKLTASLYDAQGRQVGEAQRVASPELSLDLGSLPSGVYFVRVAGDVNETLRFMK